MNNKNIDANKTSREDQILNPGSHKVRTVRLRLVDELEFKVRKPFNFRLTLWKPSHFRTDLENHTKLMTRRTFRLGETFTAVQMQMKGNTFVAKVFASGKWTDTLRSRLSRRLDAAYGLSEDISGFLQSAQVTPVTRSAATKLAGMKISCPENLFEISVLSLLMQNTTIQRSTQMLELLLIHYGAVVQVNDWSLRTFFSPKEILQISESELRTVCRLGYRAKYLPRFANFFASNKDEDLITMNTDVLKAEIQKIKGVGPYTANIVASHALRDPSALPLDVWNRKILAKALFDSNSADPARIRQQLESIFPGCAGLAALYLIEYEYFDSPLAPLEKSD